MNNARLLCVLVVLAGSTFAQTNPVPFVNQPLVPAAVAPGRKGFTLTLGGTGFVPGSIVQWNGSARATRFINGSSLTAHILATDTRKGGTASVSVVNPQPGGGTSNAALFEVTEPTSSTSLGVFGIPTADNFYSIASGDFNDDSMTDLAVLPYSGNTVEVLLGNGNGTFKPHLSYATGSDPVSIAVGDLNRDGILDLAVTNGGGASVSVLLGNGDGTFQLHEDYATGGFPMAVAEADVNRDGRLDLIVVNYYDGTVSVLLGNGDGTFQPHMDWSSGDAYTLVSVAVGDFNGDNRLDLAVGGSSDSVSILLGNGDGTFQPPLIYATKYGSGSVLAGDFSGDGVLDLALLGSDSNLKGYVTLLLGNGDGTFQGGLNYVVGTAPSAMLTTDLNGDGKLDILVLNEGSNSVSVLLGGGDGNFLTRVDYSTSGYSPMSLTAADFNADGRLDLAIAAEGGPSLFLQSTAAFSPAIISPVQLVGTQHAAGPIALTNVGPSSFSISGIVLIGPDRQDYVEQNNCPSVLTPGRSCSIGLTFEPSQIGPRTASLSVTDTAIGSPQLLPLNGVGLVQGLNATILPTFLDFGAVHPGYSSPAQQATLANYGTKTVTLNNIKITGANAGDFSEQNTCPETLPPAGSCAITLTFTPTDFGTRTASLSVSDNAPGSPQLAALSGSGVTCSGHCPCTVVGCICDFGLCSAQASGFAMENASRSACKVRNPLEELR
jgi:FG-GAP-like repeat/Abnormal spindle-like microcephaly-assoc'd, ASPM-SPD-2-Hydin